MNLIRTIFTFSMNLPIVKISLVIFLFLITAVSSSYASEEFYTIQIGSYSMPESAQQQFDSLSNELNDDELGNFRIEKVGRFYSVRLGKFMNESEAEKLLHVLTPRIRDAFTLKARILDERIVIIYESEDSLSSTVGKERIEEITEDTVPVDRKKSVEVKQVSLTEPENDDKNNSGDVTQTRVRDAQHDTELEKAGIEREGTDTTDNRKTDDGKKYAEVKQVSLTEPENDFKNNSADVTQTRARDAQQGTELERAGIEREGTDTTDNRKTRVQEYTIEIGDVLFISVWEEENLREEVIVRPDGKISFPLAGDVRAFGSTFDQLKNEITKRLKEYIKYPIVSISFRKIGGKKVIVLGEVRRPGVYSVTGRQTILEAIALASGFTLHAVKSSVIHIRGGFQAPQGTRLDLSSAVKETDVSQNIALQSEDIVYVPRRFIANVNYFVSQILGPISQGMGTYHSYESLTDD